MTVKLRLPLIIAGLSLMTGCVAYTPYPEYSDGYGYVTPVVPLPPLPVPMHYGDWGHHRHHHHY